MKKTLVAMTLLIVGGLVSTTINASARTNYNRNNERVQPKPTPNKVVSVDAAKNTIAVKEGKDTNTYTVDKFTTITVNGEKATLTGVLPGMDITVTAAGSTKASKVEATGTGEAPKTTKKKK